MISNFCSCERMKHPKQDQEEEGTQKGPTQHQQCVCNDNHNRQFPNTRESQSVSRMTKRRDDRDKARQLPDQKQLSHWQRLATPRPRFWSEESFPLTLVRRERALSRSQCRFPQTGWQEEKNLIDRTNMLSESERERAKAFFVFAVSIFRFSLSISLFISIDVSLSIFVSITLCYLFI